MLIFEIHSRPVPQKQTRLGKNYRYDPSKKEKESIIWQIRPFAPTSPLEGPIELEMTFFLPIPKGTSKIMSRQMINGMVRPTKRPDFDNLAYIVTNAMKELVYHDDSQIVSAKIFKYYGEEPKTVIRVRELTD